MRRSLALLTTTAAFAIPVMAQAASPFAGRWDFNLNNSGTRNAAWLGVTEKDGKLEVWYQPTGGNVFQVTEVRNLGRHMSLLINAANPDRPALSWELDANGDRLTGSQKRGDTTTALLGVRAPLLRRESPRAWSAPESLFNGKNLDGWEPMGRLEDSHWIVKNGLLTNEAHGANLKSRRSFDDFKLHFEVNCPDHANSGFYLRGRYEVQLEYEPLTSNPPERRIGAIYGRIAPKGDLPRKPGEWDIFDVTLVGRIVTIVRNGVTTIDHQEIEGITGGALDANEGEPGPFYIQGDHTGGLEFRNITVSVPKK